ncbi:MAG: hypothetical protein PHW13_09190, partial [Methylococcales bacterium]|nr:hypothetical protein [Methylococcales bacterium]
MKKIVIIMAAILSGCASLDRGGYQELQIQTRNNMDIARTTCTLANDNGQWKVKPVQLQGDSLGE